MENWIDGRELAIGLGLALALEGALWAAAPGAMRRAMVNMQGAPEGVIRIAALLALAVGVGIVWAARTA